MNVSLGFSQLSDPLQAANEAIGQAKVGLGRADANLAFIFSTIEFAHPLILKTANNLLGEIPILGCSSPGVITNQGAFKHGFAILLLNLNPQTFFNIAAVEQLNKKTPLAGGKELGEKLIFGFKNVPRGLSIILSNNLAINGTDLINGLQEKLGKSFPLIGASACDNFKNHKNYQYFNQELLNESCAGILFGGKFNFGFATKHGWKPLGKMRCATATNGCIINKIDGLPAVKLYEDYFAKNAAALTKELKRISTYYPLGIYLPGEKEYLLRNIISISPDGALITQGDIPQNSKIRLMISTENSRLAAAISACKEAKEALGAGIVKLVMVFASASRFPMLSRQNNAELGIIKTTFGENTPLIGIYTSGEQAPLKSINYLGQTYLHNQSINVLAIGEQ